MKYFKSRSHFQYDSDTHHTNTSPQIKTIMVYLSFKKVASKNPILKNIHVQSVKPFKVYIFLNF